MHRYYMLSCCQSTRAAAEEWLLGSGCVLSRIVIRAPESLSMHSGEYGSSVGLVHAHEVVCGGRRKLRVIG